jgi:hypothetical protein
MGLLGGCLCRRAKLGVSELSEQTNGTLLQIAGQIRPDVKKHGHFGRRRMTSHGDPSRKRCCQDGGGIRAPTEDKGRSAS